MKFNADLMYLTASMRDTGTATKKRECFKNLLGLNPASALLFRIISIRFPLGGVT